MARITFRWPPWLAVPLAGSDVRWAGLLAALFYGVTSTTMAFINKAVLSYYQFSFPFFILALQMILTVGVVEVLCWRGLVSLPPYTLKDGRAFFWPSLFCGLHGALSLYALIGLNIPMYGAVKRCTPLVNLVLSVILLGKGRPSLPLAASILVITTGCFVAALGDLSFSWGAYSLCLLSVVAQGLYLSLVQHHSEHGKVSSLRILQLNSYNTLGPYVLMSLLMGDLAYVGGRQCWQEPWFVLLFTLLLLVGCLFNYALFLCTTVTSALTTSLVGVGKNIVQTCFGFVAFGGVRYHPLNVAGIVMNTVGGFLYVYAKHSEQGRPAPLPPPATSSKYFKDQNLNHVLLPNGGGQGSPLLDDQLLEVRTS